MIFDYVINVLRNGWNSVRFSELAFWYFQDRGDYLSLELFLYESSLRNHYVKLVDLYPESVSKKSSTTFVVVVAIVVVVVVDVVDVDVVDVVDVVDGACVTYIFLDHVL